MVRCGCVCVCACVGGCGCKGKRDLRLQWGHCLQPVEDTGKKPGSVCIMTVNWTFAHDS